MGVYQDDQDYVVLLLVSNVVPRRLQGSAVQYVVLLLVNSGVPRGLQGSAVSGKALYARQSGAKLVDRRLDVTGHHDGQGGQVVVGVGHVFLHVHHLSDSLPVGD
eukprot:TRINITY_DN79323_c0_g1_i1.p1 TRINITY_DN79323_c0_g1~~TRINITY_DN79323_c0_g1_i1.p1  ORF type:complete len:105 (+),score=16.32 TRINITY_DN79323_c0_g1_i1:125-439(+)